MTAKQLLWYPGVHERFGESLSVFLIRRTTQDKSEFYQAFRRFVSKARYGGYRVYEVFGTSDYLVKIWLPPDSEKDFAKQLKENISAVDQVRPFKVTERLLHWTWADAPSPQKTDLDKVTTAIVKDLQNRKENSPHFPWARKAGLCEMADLGLFRGGRQYIRFATAVSLQQHGMPQRDDQQIRRIIEVIKDKSNFKEIEHVSVYAGFGMCSILIMADVATSHYYLVSKIIELLHPAAAGAASSTYLVASEDPLICDDIGEAAISKMEPIDQAVQSVFPELYEEPRAAPPLHRKIEGWVRQHVVDPAVEDAMFERVKGPLLGVKKQDTDLVNAQLFLEFQRCERFLRERREGFIRQLLGPEAIGRITQSVVKAPPGDEGPVGAAAPEKRLRTKKFPLGVLLDIFGRTIGEKGLNDGQELVGGWEKGVRLRNEIAHGDLDPFPNWEPVISDFLSFIRRFAKLSSVVNIVVPDTVE